MIQKLIQTDTSKTIILIRLMVGGVFLSEGIQKFLYAARCGAGRFEKMGFPNPEFFGNFVGLVEIMAGLLILAGLLTRAGALATLIIYTYYYDGCNRGHKNTPCFRTKLRTFCTARTQQLRLLEYGP